MPRDEIITDEKRKAVKEAFDRNIRQLGRTHCISYIYDLTARSPAPSYFISYKEARRIIFAYNSGRLRYRCREITTRRDRDFIDAYRRFMVQNQGCLKRWAIETVIASQAPSFYIDGKMVASIISGREDR